MGYLDAFQYTAWRPPLDYAKTVNCACVRTERWAYVCVMWMYVSRRAKFSRNRWQQRSGSLSRVRTREGKERTRSIGTDGHERRKKEKIESARWQERMRSCNVAQILGRMYVEGKSGRRERERCRSSEKYGTREEMGERNRETGNKIEKGRAR